MPGVSQTTYLALQEINSLPVNEQRIARLLYFKFETIVVLLLLPYVGGIIVGMAAMVLLTKVWGKPSLILVGIVFLFGFVGGHFLIRKIFTNPFTSRICAAIKDEISKDDLSKSAFVHLREKIPFIDALARSNNM